MKLNRHYDELWESLPCDWELPVTSISAEQTQKNKKRNRFLKFMYLKIRKTVKEDPNKG